MWAKIFYHLHSVNNTEEQREKAAPWLPRICGFQDWYGICFWRRWRKFYNHLLLVCFSYTILTLHDGTMAMAATLPLPLPFKCKFCGTQLNSSSWSSSPPTSEIQILYKCKRIEICVSVRRRVCTMCGLGTSTTLRNIYCKSRQFCVGEDENGKSVRTANAFGFFQVCWMPTYISLEISHTALYGYVFFSSVSAPTIALNQQKWFARMNEITILFTTI